MAHGHDGHDGHDDHHGATPQSAGDEGKPLERDKLAHLIRHWIEHNEGHRRGYLEWREKLEGEKLPRTYAAMGYIADLTEEMSQALRDALAELE